MKLIRNHSQEKVEIGDSLYYHGNVVERYTYIGPTDNGFIKAHRHGKTTIFNPDIFNCSLGQAEKIIE